MPLQIDVAELGGLVGECIIFGMHFILLCRAARSYILRWRRHENVAWPIPAFAGTMFLLATGQVICDSINIFIAFFHHETRAERIAFMKDATQAVYSWRYGILTVMILVADCLMHYRCYIIWKRRIWIVLLPLTLSLGGCICGFLTIGLARRHALLTLQTQSALLTSFFALTFSANVISTVLLTYKLWKHDRAAKKVLHTAESAFAPVIRIVVESGAMTAAYHLVYVITLETRSEALETTAEMASPVFALISTLLIIRVQHNSDRRETRRSTTRPGMIEFRVAGTATGSDISVAMNTSTSSTHGRSDVEDGKPASKHDKAATNQENIV
ncbi:hypothetical protein EVG20_g6941 [Dentipellis fragilis]|uniref:Uncharacterized protein n=1 Tax=Dentipellis fragilis TaxID=205917 RepID=A0A4Y9YLC2_9AGAM|nr:hypothetical protein EVG20_g6941 [Dentipellis fragilis]